MAFEILEQYDACDGHRVEVLVDGVDRRLFLLSCDGPPPDVNAAVQEVLDAEAARAAEVAEADDWQIVEP